MCFAKRDRLHLLFAKNARMIFLGRRNAANDYILATLNLNFTILRAVGGRELTVAHAYSLRSAEMKLKWSTSGPALNLLRSACFRFHAHQWQRLNKNI